MSMRPVQLRFCDPVEPWGGRIFGHTSATWMKAVGALLLLTALGSCAAALWRLGQTQRELAAARQALEGTRRPADPASSRQHSATRPEMTAQQRQAWAQVARQLNTPWSGLLDGLERATPDDVALVSIEPDARQGSIRVQAEARTLDALLGYAARLTEGEAFGGVTLVKHETNEQDANRPLRLSLNVQLRSPAKAASSAAAAGGER